MTNPPRVLGACDWLVKYSAGLARGLADAGASAALVTRDHDHEFGGRPGAMRAHIGPVLGSHVAHITVPGRPRDVGAIRGTLRAARRARRFVPDVVHLQSTVISDPRLPFVAGARPGRYALTVHDVTRHPGDRAATALRERLERAIVAHAALTFVHADRLVEDLHRRFGNVPVAVVPMGVDPPEALPLPERPALLFFGRLSVYKGLDVLLDALPLVWRSVPGLELTIAGAGELPDHPGLDDPRVHVRAGHVPEDELSRYFAAASCVVLPYREASQSAVGAQAKRFGRGLVVTDVGGLPELVADGSGLVVAPEDPAALAEAVVRVAGTPELAGRLARAAAAGATGSDWRAVGALTLAAYERAGLLPAGRGSPARTASNSSA